MRNIIDLDGTISIHALREEGDPTHVVPRIEAALFLSTPSARRATSDLHQSTLVGLFLSTPSARRATVSL